eukprot:COSAG06_NODE_3193_length_5704_cov_6.627119_4_plen_212_part_00
MEILGDVNVPSTWTEAREALSLSIRQAVWSCGGKLLFWHWVQPMSYFLLFDIYYCSLNDETRTYATFVAYREVLYLLFTLLALWLNPAYLLLELDPVLKPRSSKAIGIATVVAGASARCTGKLCSGGGCTCSRHTTTSRYVWHVGRQVRSKDAQDFQSASLGRFSSLRIFMVWQPSYRSNVPRKRYSLGHWSSATRSPPPVSSRPPVDSRS